MQQRFRLSLFLCAILCATVVTCEHSKSADHGSQLPRVIGGFNATAGQFKYAASLQIFNRLHYCGGAILSQRTILTAGHCRKKFEIYAMVGSIYYQDFGAERYRVKEFIVHELFNPATLNYDIALAILDESIQFNGYTQPIRLTKQPPMVGERLIVHGWGYTSYPPPSEGPPNRMQWMRTNIIEDVVCADFHPDVDTNLCIYEEVNRGICSGDSGGPLVNEMGEVVGVISAGYPCAIGYPDSCTSVFILREWILAHIV